MLHVDFKTDPTSSSEKVSSYKSSLTISTKLVVSESSEFSYEYS